MRYFFSIGIAFYLLFCLLTLSAHAASLVNVSNTVSRLKMQEAANHTIQFTTSSGMLGGNIQVFFGDAVSSMNSVDYTDIDLLYGPVGQEVQYALYSQPGTNVWGVNVDSLNKILTLTYPITNGFPILSNQRVILKIGTHATNDLPPAKTQFRQLINGTTAALGQIVRIQTQNDSGTLAIPIVSEDSIGVSCQSTLAAPTDLRVENSAGTVKLSWTDAANNEDGFFVERSREISVATAEGLVSQYTPFDQVLNIHAANTIQTVDDKIQAGTTYQYRTRAYNTCGFSGYSNVASVKTPDGANASAVSIAAPVINLTQPEVVPIAPQSVVSPPAEPQKTIEAPVSKPVEQAPQTPQGVPNVSGIRSSSTSNAISLQWQNPPLENVGSIQIRRSAISFPQSTTDGVLLYSGTGTSFTDSGLSAGNVYYYTIFVVSKTGSASSGSLLAVAVKEVPQPPITIVEPTPQQPVEIPTVVAPPIPASQNMLQAGPSGPTAVQTTTSGGEPIVPAIVVTLPAEQSSVEVRRDEEQRTSSVVQDSSGGTSAFTIDIPKQAFTEEAEVAVTTLTTTQTQIIDENATVPAGHEAVGNVVYKIQVRNQQGDRIQKFDKPIRLTFRYNASLIQTVSEDSLKIFYWESSLNSWIALPSHIDTANHIIVAEVSHATLFSIFGEQKKDITIAQKKKLLVASQSTAIIKRPGKYLFSPSDLNLTTLSRIRGVPSEVRFVDQTFYVTPSSILDICVPASFFDKTTDTVILTIGDSLHQDQYFLQKNQSRNCYETSFVAPHSKGLVQLSLKSKNSDDAVRTNQFQLMVAPFWEVLIVPSLLNAVSYFGSIKIMGLILLLFIIVVCFVLADVYQKVIRGGKKSKNNRIE